MPYGKESGQLSPLRPLIDGMQGHNFALPDCLKFLLECMGEEESLDFWDIAALTGDTVAQVYDRFPSDRREYCVSGYLAGRSYMAYVFDVLGYGLEYAESRDIAADPARYREKVAAFIDRGIPVLAVTNLRAVPGWESDVGTHALVVGYADSGRILKLLVRDTVVIDYVMPEEPPLELAFIGEKQRQVSLAALYRAAILRMPYWLTLPEREGKCFGPAAYRAWADDIEAGRFEDESLPLWENYGVYVCNLATSGGLPVYLFRRLAQEDPALAELSRLGEEIGKLLPTETPAGGRSLLWIRLEELGGGMDMQQVRLTMGDRKKRAAVAATLREYAGRLDRVLELLQEGLCCLAGESE